MEKEFNLSEKIFTQPDRAGREVIMSLEVKEFIKRLKEHPRFNQAGRDLRDELDIVDIKKIQKIQLIFTEILLEIDKLAGDKLA